MKSGFGVRAHGTTRGRARCATLALIVAAGCGAGDAMDDESAGTAAGTDADAGVLPAVEIVEPVDGAEVSGPVRVVLASENIEIVPAGDMQPNGAHYHLFLNRPTVEEGVAVPQDDAYIVHLGDARAEHTFTDLPAGEYTLVAVLGDGVHRVIAQASDTVRFRVAAPGT